MTRIRCLLERGTPPRVNPVMAQAFSLLEEQGFEVLLHYPELERVRLDTLQVDADLYLLKSDTELALSLSTALEHLGAHVINRARASRLAKDKLQAARILAQAGIGAPRSLSAGSPARLAPDLAAGPLIFKPHRGYHGAGIAVVDHPGKLPQGGAYPEVAFAQQYLAGCRRDLKVFGIGDHVSAVRKRFASDSFVEAGEPTRLAPDVEDLAHRCAAAFGLELYGLDIAETPDGPLVIDVNYFPGYRGVPDAAQRLATYIADAARRAY